MIISHYLQMRKKCLNNFLGVWLMLPCSDQVWISVTKPLGPTIAK